MGDEEDLRDSIEGHKRFIRFYKKWVEPFVAVLILVMLVSLVFALVNESKTTKQIQENCGWGDEDYYCWCQYDDVRDITTFLNEQKYGADLSDLMPNESNTELLKKIK